MTTLKKFAWYGSSVAFAALLAVTLLVSAPVKTAEAALSAVSVTPASAVAGATTTYTVTYTDAAANATGNTIVVTFGGAAATGAIQPLANATAALGAGFTGCTVASTGVVGAVVTVTLGEATAGACAAGTAAGTKTLTITNVRNGLANDPATPFTGAALASVNASNDAGAVNAGNNVTFTPIGISITTGIGVGATLSQTQAVGGNAIVNAYPTNGLTTVSFSTTQGVFGANGGTTLVCQDGSACDQDAAANGVVSVVFVGSGTAGAASITVSGAGLTRSQNLTLVGAAASVTVAATATTINASPAGVNNSTINATVTDANGNNVPDGTPVNFITNLGTLTGGSQAATANTVNGVASVALTSQGNPGTATVTASVGSNSGSTSVIFAGATTTITARTQTSINGTFVDAAAPANNFGAGLVRVVVAPRDSAGNRVAGVTPTLTFSPAGCAVVNTTTASTATADANVTLNNGGLAAGTTCAVTATVGTLTASTTITYGTGTATTVEVTAPDVAPVGTSQISVAVKGANGVNVADGTAVTLVVSAGAVAVAQQNTVNGVATFTYVAPATQQSVNATAVSGSVSGSDTFQVTTSIPTPEGPGTFAEEPNFGTSGVADAVFQGGTLQQLIDAADDAGASVIWVRDNDGNWRSYRVGGAAFLNAGFNTAFADGFASSKAVFLVD